MSSRGVIGGCIGTLFGSGLGLCLLFCVVMVGPWCLQYDLNTLLPIIHRHVPEINDVAPVPMSFLLLVAGWIGFECAVPLAVVTYIVIGLGIIS